MTCTAHLSHLTRVQPGTLIALSLYFISPLLHNIGAEEFLESGLADGGFGQYAIDLDSAGLFTALKLSTVESKKEKKKRREKNPPKSGETMSLAFFERLFKLASVFLSQR